MAEVKITITAEDGSVKVFRAVEEAGSSAFKKIEQSAVSSSVGTTSAIEKCKESYLDFAAKALTIWAAVQKASVFAQLGAGALQAEESFRNVTNAYAEDGDRLLAKMKQVSNGIIDDSNLMQRAVKGLQQGLSGEQLVSLLEVARSSARVAGIDVASAFDRITEATANQTTRGLKALGIVIDQNKAFEDYAKKLGTSADALTELQQSQALANAAIEEGLRQMKAMGKITENATEKLQKNASQMHELQETIGKGLIIGFGTLGGVLYVVAAAALVLSAAFWKTAESAARLRSLFTSGDAKKMLLDFAEGAREAANIAYEKAGGSIGKAVKIWKDLPAMLDEASGATKGIAKTQQEAAAATALHAAQQKKLAEALPKIDEWEKSVKQMTPALSEADKSILSLTEDSMKLGREFGHLPGIAKRLSDIYDQGRANIAAKKLLEDSKTAFETTQQAAIKLLEEEKKAREDDLSILKEYREVLVKTYDEALRSAEAYYNKAQEIGKQFDDLIAHGKDFLANLDRKPQTLSQQKDALKELMDTASRSTDINVIQKAMTAAEQFLEKNKGMKSIFGFTQDFADIKEKYSGLISQAERAKSEQVNAALSAGDAWVDFANRMASAIDAVDKQIIGLYGEITKLDGLLSKTRELKIDTSMAVAQIQSLTAQITSMLNLLYNGQPAVSRGLNISGITVAQGGGNSPAFAPDSQAWADWASSQLAEYWQNWELPKYDVGTPYVPRTGPALIHQGERIMTAAENRQYSEQQTGRPISISIGDIVIQGANKDGEQLAREIARPLERELRRLAALK